MASYRSTRSAASPLPSLSSELPHPAARLQPVGVEPSRRHVILVAEDSPEDWELIEWAFDECRDQVEVRCVRDGREALDYVFREGRFVEAESSPRPSLILLDLKLPRVDGFEVLERIRSAPQVRTIPVVVFSGSDDEVDVRRAYEAGANSYVTKPESMEGYRSVIRILEAYWLRKVEMPTEG
jgi:two-component system response regulator